MDKVRKHSLDDCSLYRSLFGDPRHVKDKDRAGVGLLAMHLRESGQQNPPERDAPEGIGRRHNATGFNVLACLEAQVDRRGSWKVRWEAAGG